MSDLTLPRDEPTTPGVLDRPAPSARRSWRSLFRIRLRSLLLVALVFCLLCGWLGRNYARMRQQDVALETLKRAHASIALHSDEGASSEEREAEAQAWRGWSGLARRLTGWGSPPGLRSVLLQSVNSNDRVATEALETLAQFPEIESVALWGVGFDDSSLVALQRLPRLESLSLLDVRATSAGIVPLKSLREVHVHEVTTRDQPDDLIEGLASLKRLREISLYGTVLSRDDIEGIAALPELESLSLSEVALEDEDIYGPLDQAEGLRSLELVNSAADDDMEEVAAIRGLKRLSVQGISDVGLDRLAPLTSLERVEVWDRVTRDAARHFSAARPDCLVRHQDRWRDVRFYRWSAPVPRASLSGDDRLTPDEQWRALFAR